MISRSRSLLVVWLVLSLLLALVSFQVGREAIRSELVEQVRQHLLLTLSEAHFSSADNEVNDVHGLQRIGEQVNTALQNIVEMPWYGTQRSCSAVIRQIDEVPIGEQGTAANTWLSLPRNQIERQVGMSVTCTPGWQVPLALSGLLGVLFLCIYRFLPPPLSGRHREWQGYLAEHGYAETEAQVLLGGYSSGQLALAAVQRHCLERLHDPAKANFVAAMDIASGPEVGALDELQLEWFLLGLSLGQPVSAALSLARAADAIEIDLETMALALRGLPVPMSGTPLFYYAWYALQRTGGEGWVTNPASNRPDLAVGGDIARLMSRHGGHGRAINDLEQSGLKARTLDQNRSKVKEDIVAVLGETLAEMYLFESSKHPDGVHTRYRLRLESAAIRLLG